MPNLSGDTAFFGIRKISGSLGALHIGDKSGTQYEILTGSTGGATLKNITTIDASGLASLDGGIDVNGNLTISAAGAVAGATTIGSSGAATLDSSGAGSSFGGNLTVNGNLTVEGTTTTVNSTTITVDDKNIELGSVDTPTDNTADGGGITLKGATDHTILWTNSTDSWDFSEHVNAVSGKEFRIAGTSVLNATTLGSAVVNSSLTSVGALNGGSISSDFGDIDIGTSQLDAGTGNITNVNATTVDSTNLEVTNLKAKDGTSAGSIADSTGIVTLASSVLTTTDINGGSIDGATIGANSAAAGTFTNLVASTDLTLASGATVTAILDQDEMTSDSATALATQQSIKAYVDSQVSAGTAFSIADSDGGSDTVTVGTDTLTFAQVSNETTVAVTDNTVTIGLPNDVTLAGDLTVSGGDIDIAGASTGAAVLKSGGETHMTLSGTVDGSNRKATFPHDVAVDNGLEVADSLLVSGDASFDAGVSIATGTSDEVTLNSHLKAGASNLTIGEAETPFGFVYATNVITGDFHMKNERGDWTLFEESDHIRIRNNATGQVFKMGMTLIEE